MSGVEGKPLRSRPAIRHMDEREEREEGGSSAGSLEAAE